MQGGDGRTERCKEVGGPDKQQPWKSGKIMKGPSTSKMA